MVGNNAAVDNCTVNLFINNLFYTKRNNAVVNKYRCSGVNVLRQSLIIYIAFLSSTNTLLSCQNKLVAGYNLYCPVFKAAEADFGALCIKQCCNGKSKLFSDSYYLVKTHFVGFVIAVAEIKACDVHTLLHH